MGSSDIYVLVLDAAADVRGVWYSPSAAGVPEAAGTEERLLDVALVAVEAELEDVDGARVRAELGGFVEEPAVLVSEVEFEFTEDKFVVDPAAATPVRVVAGARDGILE